jgi:hypothetical protein
MASKAEAWAGKNWNGFVYRQNANPRDGGGEGGPFQAMARRTGSRQSWSVFEYEAADS